MTLTERTVVTRYLEMTSPAQLRAKRVARQDLRFFVVDPPWPELNRFFYTAVGGDYFWVDRLPWTYEQWDAYLRRDTVETCVLVVDGLPAGYAELDRQEGAGTEIAYFGLLPRFTGQGLGAHLLTEVVARAWASNPGRVWLHTCSLDHPSALRNYTARGFREYRVETTTKLLPAAPYGPWIGAWPRETKRDGDG